MILRKVLSENFPMLSEPELVEEIMKVAFIHEVEAGDMLIDIGEPIQNMPLLIEGSLKIVREDAEGNEMFLYYVHSGNTCAASITSGFGNQKSTIRAVVEEKAIFLAIPIKYIDQWMVKYSSWRNFILNTYNAKFEEVLKVVDMLAFHNMDERITNYLKEKAEIHNSTSLELSHQEIATDLNTSREVVSRILKRMEKSGKLKIGRGKLELVN
ncbi:MAG: Crp/Fnr family transcriptional regulator [Crocinitomicaceae bacterium]|nr:Crp/Fnr family transcriptional regulator [Crocinitomicaceae bacterium]MBK8926031.1 Crp/Fnr family transcriptional regulator [Crocinitomicaceae bacterium]